MNETSPEPGGFPSLMTVAGWIAVTIALIGLALALWQLTFVLLLMFFGVLLAVVLHHSASRLRNTVPMPMGVAMFATVALAFLVIGGVIASIGPRIAVQLGALAQTLPEALASAESYFADQPWATAIIESLRGDPADSNWNVLGAISGTVSGLLGLFANLLILITIAVFLASSPKIYRNGALSLVPPRCRPRAAEFLDEVGGGLWRWFTGQLVAMLIVALMMTAGLWLLGVPLPLALGLIAGLTNFIPYLGPYIGGAPAVLVALSDDPISALWVTVLIFVVQNVEGNLITPNIQQRAVSIAPALIIVGVVSFGILFGLMGILLATPLLFVIVTAIRMFYVEDYLGDGEVGHEGADEPH